MDPGRFVLVVVLVLVLELTLSLQYAFIVGWALPTKNKQIQLLTVGIAHPTGILLESTNGEFQTHRRISFNAYIYAVGETNSS